MIASNLRPLTPDEQVGELRLIEREVERLKAAAMRAEAGFLAFMLEAVLAEVRAVLDERNHPEYAADLSPVDDA